MWLLAFIILIVLIVQIGSYHLGVFLFSQAWIWLCVLYVAVVCVYVGRRLEGGILSKNKYFWLICWFWSSLTFVALMTVRWFSECKNLKRPFLYQTALTMTTVLTSQLTVRMSFCLFSWGLSDVLEKSQQRKMGHVGKQHQVCRVWWYQQRVSKL